MHPCPHCSRTFAHSNALFSHAKAKHGMKAARLAVPDHPVVLQQAEFTRRDQERARRECNRELSMADLVIEASFNRAMGLPVDHDIADMFDV